jgi:hypothetical protein
MKISTAQEESALQRVPTKVIARDARRKSECGSRQKPFEETKG